MNVLITGIAGFVGGHLVDLLHADEPEARLFGLVRPGWPVPAGLDRKAELIETELEEAEPVARAVERAAPDRIVHLAAQSSPRLSWDDPAGTFRTNVLGLLHILEAVRVRHLTPRTLVVGSAEEYGAVRADQLPIEEDLPLKPLTPYAASKVAQDFLAQQYALGSGLPIVRTRTFHHTGPGRGATFAESSFARQIVAIENGKRPAVVRVGNLDSVRDFTDVRDVVRAYRALIERGEPGAVYNVCSGRPARIGDMLETLVGLARVPIAVEVDPERVRPLDVPAIVGDNQRLRRATGWEPTTPLATTLGDLLEATRAAAAAEG